MTPTITLTPAAEHSHRLRQQIASVIESNMPDTMKTEELQALVHRQVEWALASYKKGLLEEAKSRGDELVLPPVVGYGWGGK